MILLRQTLLAILLSLGAHALTAEEHETADRLLAIADREEFIKACGEAAATGLPSQTLLEIRFLHLVDHGDRRQLAELSKDLEAYPHPFRADESLIFAVPEDFQAVIEYSKALVALEAEDDVQFKKHITEAFWLSPKQSQLFGQHIEQRRLNQYLKNLEVDLSRALQDQLDPAAQIVPAALVKDRSALLLSFWSPWSNSVEEDLPALRSTANKLKDLGLPMVSVLLDGNEQHRLEADAFVTTKAFDLPVRWLADHPAESLTDLLRISEVPAFVLLSPDGRVLYHGKMNDPRFSATLAATLAPPADPSAPADPARRTIPVGDPSVAGPVESP